MSASGGGASRLIMYSRVIATRSVWPKYRFITTFSVNRLFAWRYLAKVACAVFCKEARINVLACYARCDSGMSQ